MPIVYETIKGTETEPIFRHYCERHHIPLRPIAHDFSITKLVPAWRCPKCGYTLLSRIASYAVLREYSNNVHEYDTLADKALREDYHDNII